MQRYFFVFIHFVKNNLMREMEFRANFLMSIVMQFLWSGVQLIFIALVFQYTRNIYNWSQTEMFFLMGLFRIVKAIFDIFFLSNIKYLPENVNRGELDYSLTRPINTLFLTSLRKHNFDNLGHFIAGIAIVIYTWSNVNPTSIIPLVFLTILGTLAFYVLMMSFAMLTFFTERLTALSSVYDIFNTTLRLPIDLYTRHNGFLDFVTIPILIIATLPAKIILGKISNVYIAAELILVILGLAWISWFWKFALHHYSSASS